MAKTYTTTIKVVNDKGVGVKANVICSAKDYGYTNDKGLIDIEVAEDKKYVVYAKRNGQTAQVEVKGGGSATIRFK